ncbi:TerD family protein [Nocardia callitridis]
MALPDGVVRVDVVIGWTDSQTELDASALLLGDDGKVGGDADFVFYNQPQSPNESVRFLGTSATEDGTQARIAIDLSAVPNNVHTIVVAGSVGAETFGKLGKLSFLVVDEAGSTLAEFLTADATTESALVFGEVYRRDETWKIRAVGQGWASGLAGMATDFGVTIDDADTEPDEPPSDAAPVDKQPAQSPADTAPPPRPAVRKQGVRTAKRAVRKAKPVELTLAESDSWTPARLFSVIGVGNGEEQERRATSALLATMQTVRPFARAVCARIGAPVGVFEGYVEVPFERGESKVIPDAVLKVARGSRIWTGLLEVKTGNAKLRRDQLESYLDVARRKKYDVVVSLSNDIPAGPGELPVEVDRRKLTKVALRHLSWAEIAHEARMLLSHGGIDNELHTWILSEFLRYLDHPKSGATEFADMGKHWVAVRDSVTAGILRAGDQKALSVADTWTSLSRHLALRLTAELGATVKHVLPRRHRSDPAARTIAVAERLANEGVFEAVLQIPGAPADLVVTADVRTNKVSCRTTLDAPTEGTSTRRLSWLLKQLDAAPGDLQVEATYTEQGIEVCEHLATVRDNPKLLTGTRSAVIISFTLTQTFPMGNRRAGTAASFIASVTSATDTFHSAVVRHLREWTPPTNPQPDAETVGQL